MEDHSSQNSSSHMIIISKILVKIDEEVKKKTSATFPKIKWNGNDLVEYKNLVSKALEKLPTPTDSDLAFEILMKGVQNAAIATMPVIKPAKRKGQLWHPKVKELMRKSKDADVKWKLAAKPHSPHPLEQDRKECRKELRSATRRTNATARDR